MTKLRAVSDDRLTVTLATGQRRALEVIARHNNTTLAFVVRYALAEFVKRNKKRKVTLSFPSN